jgi:hypothetical protein
VSDTDRDVILRRRKSRTGSCAVCRESILRCAATEARPAGAVCLEGQELEMKLKWEGDRKRRPKKKGVGEDVRLQAFRDQ